MKTLAISLFLLALMGPGCGGTLRGDVCSRLEDYDSRCEEVYWDDDDRFYCSHQAVCSDADWEKKEAWLDCVEDEDQCYPDNCQAKREGMSEDCYG